MYCIRAKFIRGEELKYISHLDIMRIFERALRRSGLPIRYSEGFNPRPSIVFGLPLPVGMTSEAEYADFVMERNIMPKEFLGLLNPQLPSGLKVVAAMQRRNKNNIMASIAAALYDVSLFSEDPDFLPEVHEELKRLLSLNVLIVEKKGKRGLKPVNIRPFILEADIEQYGTKEPSFVQGCEIGHRVCMSMLVSAGSRNNLNPRLLLEALKGDVRSKVSCVRIHRRELYIKKGEGFAVPFDE